MTWESRDERDFLADDRDRMWGARPKSGGEVRTERTAMLNANLCLHRIRSITISNGHDEATWTTLVIQGEEDIFEVACFGAADKPYPDIVDRRPTPGPTLGELHAEEAKGRWQMPETITLSNMRKIDPNGAPYVLLLDYGTEGIAVEGQHDSIEEACKAPHYGNEWAIVKVVTVQVTE